MWIFSNLVTFLKIPLLKKIKGLIVKLLAISQKILEFQMDSGYENLSEFRNVMFIFQN